MHENKNDKHNCDEKVNGARGLLAPEGCGEPRENRGDGGRHAETCPDHQREEDENHGNVREPLDAVVLKRLFWFGPG